MNRFLDACRDTDAVISPIGSASGMIDKRFEIDG